MADDRLMEDRDGDAEDDRHHGELTSADVAERSDYEQGRVDERAEEEPGRFGRERADDPEPTRRN
jgi:hypothetical protein